MQRVHLLVLVPFQSFAAALFGADSRFSLEHSVDGLGVRSYGITEKLSGNRTKFYPLPQSTAAKYIRLRPEDLRIKPFTPDRYERQEVIGPSQIDDDKIWFGNRYYDGEGMSGVGAFGYFDTASRSYTLYSPLEIARYEVSAMLVQPDKVWLALDSFIEDISTAPGGLIRWDRATQQVHRYALEFVVTRISSEGGSLFLKTDAGHALLREGKLQRFLNDGSPIAKFPPPPSHY